jgi:hypothetical protein
MVDPKVLEDFNRDLALLVGERYDDTHIWLKGDKIVRHIVRLGLKNRDTAKNLFTLEIANCAWQVLHENLVVFSYMGDVKEIGAAKLQLENLVGEIVSSIHFNLEDLTLLIRFESTYALKLIHSKEPAWSYTFRLGTQHGMLGDGLVYMIENENLIDGIWHS